MMRQTMSNFNLPKRPRLGGNEIAFVPETTLSPDITTKRKVLENYTFRSSIGQSDSLLKPNRAHISMPQITRSFQPSSHTSRKGREEMPETIA